MKENEIILQKLRNIHMNETIKLKNEYPENEEVEIEDVFYCGKFLLDIDGHMEEKDVFFIVKNIDGNIQMEYHTEDDLIAKDYGEIIEPTEIYQYNNFKEISDDKNRVSLNELENDRIKNISNNIGIDEKDIQASCEIDSKELDEEKLLKKYANIKSEFNVNQRITSSENFGNIVPGTNKFSKIAVVYSDKTSDRFIMVGITSDGQVEKIDALERTEGVNPTEEIVTSNRDGSSIESKKTQSMYKIKGRPNEGFSMNIGNSGGVEVNYVRRSGDDDYISIPVEATHTRRVDSKVKEFGDKTKNTYADDEIERAEKEFDEHNGKTVIENINDNPNDDKNHEDVFVDKEGNEIDKKEFIKKIGQMYDEEEIKKRIEDGQTLDEIEDDANRDFIHPTERDTRY